VTKALKTRKSGGWRPSAGYYGFSAALPRIVMGGDDRIWCGHWDEERVNELERYVAEMDEGELKKARGVIKGVGEVTVRGVIKLWEKRKEKRGDDGRFCEEDEEEGDLLRDGKYWQDPELMFLEPHILQFSDTRPEPLGIYPEHDPYVHLKRKS
jgi:hypothetical protein